MGRAQKIIASIFFVLAGSSSLLALDKDSFILYPEAGLGLSGGFADVLTKEGAGLTLGGGSLAMFKDPKSEVGFSWSLGCGADYAFADSLAFTSGIFIDKTPYKIIYQKTGSAQSDLKIKMNFTRLNIPAGLRFYKDRFIMGAGVYIASPLFCEKSVSYESSTKKTNLAALAAVGFFIDAGLNFYEAEEHNLLAFLRFKNDLSYAYKEEDIVSNIKTFSLNLTFAYGFRMN